MYAKNVIIRLTSPPQLSQDGREYIVCKGVQVPFCEVHYLTCRKKSLSLRHSAGSLCMLVFSVSSSRAKPTIQYLYGCVLTNLSLNYHPQLLFVKNTVFNGFTLELLQYCGASQLSLKRFPSGHPSVSTT